jgi:hypothetical protein
MGLLDTTSQEMFFGKEPKQNKDLVTTLPQPNIKNLVTFFVYLEPK